MKIRELEICGFKSFKDSTKLSFDRPITGVVGPNGCGKSNILDALRWCMGEQRPRMLRGDAMEDVIFNGSEKEGPVGMAEVTARFVVEEGDELPDTLAGCKEIEVTRRLFRSGESEYLLNRTVVRLKDVAELFLGTGAGRNAYSMIGQGQITSLVAARPEERRTFVEEAAGITKFKARRRQAELKLKATKDNLDRVNDVITEVKRSVISLSRQAKKAERYKKTREELRNLELKLAAAAFRDLTSSVDGARARVEELESKENENSIRVEALEAELEKSTAQSEEHENALTEAQEALLDMQARQERLQRRVEVGEQELDGLDRRNEERLREISDTKERIRELHAEIEKIRDAASSLARQSLDFENRLRQKQAQRDAAAVEQARLANLLEEARTDLLKAVSILSEGKSKSGSIQLQKTSLKAALAGIESELKDTAARISDLQGNEKRAEARLEESRSVHEALKQRIKAQEQLIEDLASERMTAEAQVMALREELGDKRSRLESLKDLHKSFEGFGRGVRSVMAERNRLFGDSHDSCREGEGGCEDRQNEHRKVYGVVADLFETPARYETAVAAVLGERLQNVIVESHREGVAAIEYLKNEAKGRCSFIPLKVREPEERPFPPMGRHGVVGRLIDLVSWQKPYERIARYLLGDVVVVESLEHALELFNANGFRKTIVSLDGDVVDPHGVVTGGTEDGPERSILRNKRLIRDLEKQVAELEQRYQLARERKEQLTQRTSILASQMEELKKASHDRELDLVSRERDLSVAREDLSRTIERKRELQAKYESTVNDLQALSEQAVKLDKEIAEAEELKSVKERAIQENHGLAAALKAKLERLQEELTSLKVRSAAVAEKRDALEANIRRLEMEITGLEQRRERLRQEVSEANRRSVELREEIRAARRESAGLETSLSEYKEKIADLKAAREDSASKRQELENSLKQARLEKDKVSSELSEQRIKAAELDVELKNLEDKVRERYQLGLQEVEEQFGQGEPPTEDDEEYLLSLRRKLEAMGEVNLTAIDEYKEVRERYDFLTNQRADLEKTIASLRQAIQKMNREARERFHITFNELNEQFKQVFPRLFNGGRARLVLTGSDDVLEAGVEIVAQPPGKKLQSVNLLSGGEKALAGIALLFALFQVKPPPFCVLDEVDAPLDDANVGRYLGLIEELSQKTQFIMVTHNKVSMELADKLYGVTMAQPGVSQLVSVELKSMDPEFREAARA